jgi:hypothetical protein
MKSKVFIFAVLALFSMHCWAMNDDDQACSSALSAEDDSYSTLSDSASWPEDSDVDDRTFFLHLSNPRFASFYFSIAGAYKENVIDWVRLRDAWKQIPKPQSHAREIFFNAPFSMHKWCAIITKAVRELGAQQDIFIIEDSFKYGLIVKLTTPDEHSRKELVDRCQDCDPLNDVFTDERELDAYLEKHIAQIKDIEEYARNLRATTKSRAFQKRYLIDF